MDPVRRSLAAPAPSPARIPPAIRSPASAISPAAAPMTSSGTTPAPATLTSGRSPTPPGPAASISAPIPATIRSLASATSPAMAPTMCCGPAQATVRCRPTSGNCRTANGRQVSVQARTRPAIRSQASAISPATARRHPLAQLQPPAMSTSGNSPTEMGRKRRSRLSSGSAVGQIAGVGDFTGNGIDDVLWTNSSNGQVQTDIWELGSNGQWVASVSPGSHPAGYQVAGIGDFTGNGTSDILWQNSATGDIDEWQIAGGKWAASVDLGAHPGNTPGLWCWRLHRQRHERYPLSH